ncbi:MAG: amino acid adenylation domain-containing protein [Acidimicrobiia bacterium]|nr:amino acid adenylation domain-containing protein [Acidimicrobiia bacterium]
MTVAELLDDCRRLGIALWAEGDRLHIRGPAAAATPALQDALRQHKPELLRHLLAAGGPAPAPAAASDAPLPLSPGQQALWFLHRLDPETLPAYNIRKAIAIDGALDIDRWQTAFRAVVARHEALRTRFDSPSGHPVAHVEPIPDAEVDVVKLTSLDAGARESEVARLVDEEGRRVFDLTRAPLFRATLLRVSDTRSIFLLNACHLVADAWSAGVMLREMADTYAGRAVEAAPDQRFADYVRWQRQRAERGGFDAGAAWWSERLHDLPHLDLPADAPARRAADYAGDSVSFALPADLSRQIRAFSREAGATVSGTLLAAFAALLSRFTRQTDVPIGTSVAARTRTELETVVGFLANVIVTRVDLSARPTFREVAARVQQLGAETVEQQDVPFDLVVRAVRPERAIGANPLFQVLFLFLQDTLATLVVPGLSFREQPLPSVTSKYDLSLHVTDSGRDIGGLIEYRTSLFARGTIERLRDGWLALVGAAIADPDRLVADLPILGGEARHALIHGRNQVEPAVPPHPTLHEWFAAQAARTPDRLAVDAMTYRELDDRSLRLARSLRARGVGPETRVGLLFDRSAEMIVAILGVLRAGGAYVPLDPGDPPSRIETIRTGSGMSLLLTSIGTDETGQDQELPRVAPNNAAYVIYTSGSTGQPRGVVVTHENVTRLMAAAARRFTFDEHDVWTLFHSFAFDFSVWEMWGALLHGGRVVVVPHLVSRSPEAFLALLANERVTVLSQTPSAFRSIVALDAPATPLALRYVVFGGEALDPGMLVPWIDRYGDEAPRLVNMYGITETSVHVTWRRITRADALGGSGSLIGERLADLTLYVLDDGLHPVPDGVTGELHVGGAGLARGYLGRPGTTAARFVANPFSETPGARLYRTGDLARWKNGELEYLGRADAQVKIRGFRIEPGEIEGVLLAHPGVQECVVVAREDQPGHRRLVAYVLPAAGPIDPSGLRRWCADRLPPHMVPGAWVPVTGWPRTRNDKLDRARLPAPDGDAAARQAYVAPRNDAERAIAAAWSRVLGVTGVGAHDDFFALGGDSILTLDVLAQLRSRGLRSSVAQIYGHPRLADLAAVVQASSTTGTGLAPFALIPEADRALVPPGVEDAYPLTQVQAGMLYEEQVNAGRAVYHDIFDFRFRVPLDDAAWTRVLQELIDRHPALRTAFELARFSEPLQLVYTHVPAPCTFEDVGDLPASGQDARVAAWIEEERHRRFEYSQPGLLRFHLMRRSADTTEILLGFHHGILDGWSVASMMTHLLLAYRGQLEQRPLPPLEAPPARPVDVVALERTALAEEGTRRFWRDQTAELPASRLFRRADAPAGARRITTHPVAFGDEVSAGLEDLAEDAGVPLKSVLLAAHLRVLGVITGQAEVVSGLVTNGRPEGPGGDRVLGLFLNTLPLRFDLGEGTYLELARRAFDAERRLLPYRHFPMPAVRRMAGGTALFDATFNFNHFHVYDEIIRTTGLDLLHHRVLEETDFPFLVTFSVFPGSSQVELSLIYDESEFEPAQVETIAGYYTRCIETMAARPQTAFHTHSLLSAEERAVLEEWGGGAERYDTPEGLMHLWFERKAAEFATRVALRGDGLGLTYRELDARANRLAHHLRDAGIGPETFVGICTDRCLDMVVALLGILKAGGAYIPLDPAYPAERLKIIIEDSQVPIVVTQMAHEENLQASGARLVVIDREADAIAARPSTPVELPIDPDRTMYVMYTSGSTGKPKGCVVTHRHVIRLMHAMKPLYDLKETDVWSLLHSYGFDFAVWELWGAFLYGGCAVVVPYSASRVPEEFFELLAAEGVTILNTTPLAFYRLMGVDDGRPLRLRYVIFAGESIDIPRMQAWFDRRGYDEPLLVNMYGITETTVHLTWRPLRPADSAKPASYIGRTIGDMKALVLDPAMQLVPIGVTGEIFIGGPGVTGGYLRRPETTAEKFVVREGERLYRTGDLARWLPTGEMEYQGRIDHQIKIRGHRIELGEVEHVLRATGSLRDVAVLSPSGDSLVAYCVPLDGRAPTPRELREFCEKRLADYMVPTAYVMLEGLPITSNGKLDRRALPAPGAGALPEQIYVAPGSDIEAQLCAFWEQLLGVSPVGIRHDFFQIGGDSLHAVQLMARIRDRFQVDVPLRALFQESTIEKLADLIARQRGSGSRQTGPVVRRAVRRAVRLTEAGEVVES